MLLKSCCLIKARLLYSIHKKTLENKWFIDNLSLTKFPIIGFWIQSKSVSKWHVDELPVDIDCYFQLAKIFPCWQQSIRTLRWWFKIAVTLPVKNDVSGRNRNPRLIFCSDSYAIYMNQLYSFYPVYKWRAWWNFVE